MCYSVYRALTACTTYIHMHPAHSTIWISWDQLISTQYITRQPPIFSINMHCHRASNDAHPRMKITADQGCKLLNQFPPFLYPQFFLERPQYSETCLWWPPLWSDLLPVISSVMCFNEDWRYQFTLAEQFLPSGAHLGGPWPPRWAPEGRELSHEVVVIDRFHCTSYLSDIKNIFSYLTGVSCSDIWQIWIRFKASKRLLQQNHVHP